jgi:ribosomal 30S subunit maturation factor RimM
MHNLLERVRSLQWPLITVVKLIDKTRFRTLAQLLLFIPQKKKCNLKEGEYFSKLQGIR